MFINGAPLSGSFDGLFPDGSSGSPSISFIAETTLGFYRAAALTVGLSGAIQASANGAVTSFERTGVNGVAVAGLLTLKSDAKTAGDGQQLTLQALNSVNAVKTYGFFRSLISDATSTSEDSSIEMGGLVAGAATTFLSLSGTVGAFPGAISSNLTGSAASPNFFSAGSTGTGVFFPSGSIIGFAQGGAESARFTAGVLTMTNASGGLGYGTGSGGQVTQATSKTTSVTLNRPNGEITMNNAALGAATEVQFTLNNSTIAADDLILAAVQGPGAITAYTARARASGAGTAVFNVRNNTGGSLSESVLIQFAVIKSVKA